MFHYLHMARGNYRDYLRGDEVSHKKYFYVLRPLLAVRWIEADAERAHGPVPMEFQQLLDAVVDADSVLRRDIDELLAQKRAGDEMGKGPHIESIGRFIDEELSRLEHLDVALRTNSIESGELDAVFRRIIAAQPGN